MTVKILVGDARAVVASLPDESIQACGMTPEVAALIGLVHGARIDLTNEKNAQAELFQIFQNGGFSVRREVRLSARDIPDMMVYFSPPPAEWSGKKRAGLAVEVKLKGAVKMDVFRQLTRYAKHDEVEAVLLVTSLAMGLPPMIEGKSAWYASLGRGWL